MTRFTEQIQQKLAPFLAFSEQNITISYSCFSFNQGSVAQFIQEILATSQQIETQRDSHLLAFQTQRLVEQFDCLQKAINTQITHKQRINTFRSNYRFPKNIHRLPYEKRLEEYQKALRALNEKISWLIEQSQQANESARPYYMSQIEETEYRKKKCIDAIEDLITQNCKN